MPFGTKEGISFDRVYSDFLKPALNSAGFEVFRADEAREAGNIRTDMFQELLLADLVVADLSIDNPNAWYELGVRHALRRRGVIQIKCRQGIPFDVSTDRCLSYHLKDGVPDPAYLNSDKAALAAMATDTMASWRGRQVSPVYLHLPDLEEPCWDKFIQHKSNEFWDMFCDWQDRVAIARQKGNPGDIMVLAEQAPTRVLALRAFRHAAESLTALGQFAFALEQIDKALNLSPDDLKSRRCKGILLGRLKRRAEAKVWLQALISKHREDAESWALLGRVEKDEWLSKWRSSKSEMRKDAAEEDNSLREAIEPYVEGFRRDPTHYYSGINAVTLLHLLKHLTGEQGEPNELAAIEGGVRWAVRCALEKEKETREKEDYYARATLAELEVLVSDSGTIEKAYKHAAAAGDCDWFKLNSSREQLLILRDLDFRPAEVASALKVLDRALEKLERKELSVPRKVFLFSGHMIDAPDRPEPRFPPSKERVAQQAIAQKLAKLDAGADDLAICSGACGGDLLFAESCLERGLRLEVHLPFEVPLFIEKSVSFAGESWRNRFMKVCQHKNTKVYVMTEELGPTPRTLNPYERNNLWQLYTALAYGFSKVHFICLWNRKGGDGPGGTQHMFESVKKRSGEVYVLDTNDLFTQKKANHDSR
ncbi:MAG TPA: TRAFs-binding domain-containing protein [Burkholderiales bacterium]|nr:TRAFs-binding domain-containing protein [Burkholderiales bacterium]